MIQLNFVKPTAMLFDGQAVTDHNRGSVEISVDRIEERVRTQYGAMRKYHRADKHSFSVSWQDVPETDNDTVDGGMGARDIREFYLNAVDNFILTLSYDNEDTETYYVVFDEFSMSLSRRYGYSNLYDVSLSLEEV